MLIVSKFHDYYDTVIKTTGVDKAIVFNRATQEHFFDWPKDKRGSISHQFLWEENDHGPQPFLSFVIGFCGKTYHGIRLTPMKNDSLVDYHSPFYFLFEKEAFEWMDKEMEKKRLAFWMKEEHVPYWKNFQFPMEMFRKHTSPILLLKAPEPFDGSNKPLYINPVLRDWGFHTVIDPFTAFQEIQMFISGVLGGSEKEMIGISDKNKIVGHGFDPKWSFRKPPQDKK